ncbi:hypothetical protein V2J09_000453 [Rumex salicifolius]
MEHDGYKDQVDRVEVNDVSFASPAHCHSCMAYLQLEEEYHNRPLYVTNTKINRILLDCGSAVNLLPFRVLKSLGLNTKHLSPTFLTILSFNQVWQRARGSIALKVLMGDLYKDALFHVIDAENPYDAFLGRPWLHASNIPMRMEMKRPYEEIIIPFMEKVLTMLRIFFINWSTSSLRHWSQEMTMKRGLKEMRDRALLTFLVYL